jgi:hypothetical protein
MRLLRNNVVANHASLSRSIKKLRFKTLLKLGVISGVFYIFLLLMLYDQLYTNDQGKTEKSSLFRPMLDVGRDGFSRSTMSTRDSIDSYDFTNVCGQYTVKIPKTSEIDYNNTYWQRFVSSNGTYFLYNAYYDDRILSGPSPMVRITAMIDQISPPPIFCQLWYTNVPFPVTTRATYSCIWRSVWGNYRDGSFQPFLVTCHIPLVYHSIRKTLVLESVSLVTKLCNNATNNLRIINNRPLSGKKQFAVCMKALDFPDTDMSARLVEWIELLNLLGAEKIFFYEFAVHSNISKVLKYYHDQQLIEVQKLSLPGSLPNLPKLRHTYLKTKATEKRQNELIPYNDCLYRNMYSYDYLILLDIDEMIIPLVHANWSQFIAEVQKVSFKGRNTSQAAYSIRNVYFFR